LRCLLQRTEQYLTSSQQRTHFFRQVKGRLQHAQILVGKSDFLSMVFNSKDGVELGQPM
tara:strand:+ start:27729 stop:27905 length:177 start_codon:yes stop_codon:yes gene_type:complete